MALDPKFIREQPDQVKAGMRKKGTDPALVDTFLNVDAERRGLQQATEARQAELNAASAALAQATPEEREAKRADLRSLSDAIKEEQATLADLDKLWKQTLWQIPNLPAAEVPEGTSDKENVVLRTEGQKPEFSFQPQDHETLALKLNLLDMERAAKVSGAKFYYLKNELVILEQAVLRFALDTVRQHGFNLLTVPHLARAEAFYGVAHFVTPEDAENGDAYHVQRDDLYLIGTAEAGLINYHANEILPDLSQPLRYAGISPCYRRESGTYGKETRGLYRVHQFNKVEMVSFTRPEDSVGEHEFLLKIAEEILQKLGLHYQVVLNCGGDLGQPQVKKWDLEVWLPGMNKFGETHSCSNDTDYQARNLNIRTKDQEGKTQFVHTLNNTVLASPRILVALLENYQEANGSIRIPEILQSYTGFSHIPAR